MPAKAHRHDELESIPGIGPSLARDLRALGIRRVADLRHRDPERLYSRLNRLRGQRQDPCVLYAFRCAAYFARAPRPKAALLKWWNWKDRLLLLALVVAQLGCASGPNESVDTHVDRGSTVVPVWAVTTPGSVDTIHSPVTYGVIPTGALGPESTPALVPGRNYTVHVSGRDVAHGGIAVAGIGQFLH